MQPFTFFAMHCSAEFPQMNEAQAFEISALQEAGPEAGFAAQFGGILANAVEADVERQVTSAVEGKKQVRHKGYSSYTAADWRHFCRILVHSPAGMGRWLVQCLKPYCYVYTPAGSAGSQTAVTGQASQKHASPDSSHEGGAHSQHALGLLASRQVHACKSRLCASCDAARRRSCRLSMF